MLPTVDEALYELKLAEELNPGPWVRHSVNTGIAARNIAEKVPSLDPEKAYIVGLLHDIGRRVGIVDIPTHVYEGYRYCMQKGWDEAARICMTHSYLQMKDEFDYEPETEQGKAIKERPSRSTYQTQKRTTMTSLSSCAILWLWTTVLLFWKRDL